MSKNEATERKLIEDLGGAGQVLTGLRAFGHRVESMRSMRANLIKKHPDKWAAMYDDDIIIVDSLEEIFRILDEEVIPRGDTVIEFLDTNPQGMIL